MTPTSRSQIAFMHGAWTAVRTILIPAAWKTVSKDGVEFDPRSGSSPFKARLPYPEIGHGRVPERAGSRVN